MSNAAQPKGPNPSKHTQQYLHEAKNAAGTTSRQMFQAYMQLDDRNIT